MPSRTSTDIHPDASSLDAVHVQRVTVRFDFPVVFTRDVFRPDNPGLVDVVTGREPQRRHRVMAVLDEGLVQARPSLVVDLEAYMERHRSQLDLVDAPLVLPGGEQGKNDPGHVRMLHERLQEARLDRHSFLLAVGGGALLDMAGYAASLWHRGLRVVRVPTTVLAQNDAGLGVKTAVNAFGVKNALGTFTAPWAVINDRAMLSSLQPRDRAAGMAEAVKVALVRDPDFFAWLESARTALRAFEDAEVAQMVRRAAQLHLDHIATGGDPFEMGNGRPLDFGHWAAHKLEALSHHALRHGEAVSIGMALDCLYASEVGMLDAAEAGRVRRLLSALGLPLWDRALERTGPGGRLRVLEGLDEFREHLGGELTLPMLVAIGRARDIHEVDESVVVRCIERLQREHGAS